MSNKITGKIHKDHSVVTIESNQQINKSQNVSVGALRKPIAQSELDEIKKEMLNPDYDVERHAKQKSYKRANKISDIHLRYVGQSNANTYYRNLKKQQVRVKIFLSTGIAREGYLAGWDDYTLMLAPSIDRINEPTIFTKAAIVSLEPMGKFEFTPIDVEAERALLTALRNSQISLEAQTFHLKKKLYAAFDSSQRVEKDMKRMKAQLHRLNNELGQTKVSVKTRLASIKERVANHELQISRRRPGVGNKTTMESGTPVQYKSKPKRTDREILSFRKDEDK